MFLSISVRINRLLAMPKNKGVAFYAVRKGRQIGIFHTWAECEKQVKGYPYPRFKKFFTVEEAQAFLCGHDEASPQKPAHGTPTSHAPPGETAALGKPFPGWKEYEKHNSSMTSSSNSEKLSTRVQNDDWGFSAADASRTGTYPIARDNATMLSLKKCVANMKKANSQARTYITEAEGHIAELQANGRGSGCQGSPAPAKRPRIEASEFEAEKPDAAVVYTDGACSDNGKVGARAGIGVYWGPNSNMNISERLGGRQTNNRAEIHAAIRAIRQAKNLGMDEITVKTDSKFMIESITKWISGWKRRNWVLSSGGPVKNKEDFIELDAVMEGIKVNWVHVRGHVGEPGNEAADTLAVKGAEMPAVD